MKLKPTRHIFRDVPLFFSFSILPINQWLSYNKKYKCNFKTPSTYPHIPHMYKFFLSLLSPSFALDSDLDEVETLSLGRIITIVGESICKNKISLTLETSQTDFYGETSNIKGMTFAHFSLDFHNSEEV